MKFYSLEEEIKFSHRRYIISDEILKMIISKGYSYLEPDIFDDYDQFSKENKRQNIVETVKLFSNDGKINILASDLTRTLISDIKKRGDENKILKLAYQGNTFKNTACGIKKFRKIGAEYIGAKALDAEIEILNIVIEILKFIGEEYVLEISISDFLNRILESYTNDIFYSEVFEALKQRDSFKLRELLKENNELEAETILNSIFELNGSIITISERLKKYIPKILLDDSLQTLEKLDFKLNETLSGNSNLIYDMAMVSDQEYYSGIIFKAYIKNSNSPVIKGGRYTINKTESGSLEAVGFSVEIDNLNYKEEKWA